MFDHTTLVVFAVLSGALGIIGTPLYIIDIIRGGTKPHRAAFLLFSIGGAISFAGQAAEGASFSLLFAGALLVSSISIFALSLKYGTGGFNRRDKIGLVIAACALLGWFATSSAVIALILIALYNTIAKVMIMLKVHENPHTELLLSWVISTVGSFFAVLAVGSLDWVLILMPAQNGITVGLIAGIIYVRRRQIPIPANAY